MMEAHYQENSTKYFNDPITDAIKSGLTPESTEKIKIKLSLENSHINFIYQIVIKSLDNLFPEFSTEEQESKSNDSTIVFSNNLVCSYFFEEIQKIQIITKIKQGHKNQKICFQRNTRICSIVCEKGGIYKRKITDDNSYSNFKEIIVLTSEKNGPEQLYVNISFKCKKEKTVKYSDKSSKTRFLIKNNEKNIYLSEIANDKGIFDNILVPNELLSPIFSILFFNINRILTNVISINVKRFIDNSKKKRNNEFIPVPLLNKENSIITILNNSKLETKYSLFEFIKAGIRLNTFVAIDLSKKSLAQDIKKIIDDLGTILSYYASNKSKVPVFKVYGFGAKIKKNDFTNKEFFNLNLEQNPDISDFTHIIKKYKEFYNNNVNNIEYNNSNNFCPLIKEVSNEINLKYEPLEYNIFFIITSNIPKDIKEIIDSLISGSYLPFSVVIIGIGDKNFEEIKNIDNLPANSSRGIERFRNNAQFVFINKNEDNSYKLYLRKLAKQIVEYYYLNNSNPEKVKKNNIQDIKESFNK